MNYSEFLFNKLLCTVSKWFNNLEYDLQFEKTKVEYEKFLNSDYNDETKGEYDCIIKYITDYLLKDRLYTMCYLINTLQEEDIYFVTGLEYVRTSLKDIAPNTTFLINGENQLEFNLKD